MSRVGASDGHLSLRAIAAVTGVSPTTIMRDLRRNEPDPEDGTILVGKTMGADGKLRPDRRYDTSERDAKIRRLRERRWLSVREIAEAVDCSVGTVHRVLKRGQIVKLRFRPGGAGRDLR